MANVDEVRAAFRWQAGFCDRTGAPITGRICATLAEILDTATATGRRALGWAGDPIADALSLRLAGGLHALYRRQICPPLAVAYDDGEGDIGAALRAALAEHDAFLLPWLDGPPQTNDPARSGVLMAGLMHLADRFGLPFDLLEIGSSAGLNLLIDRYRFDLGGVTAGPADSPVLIRPEWRGAPPPAAAVSIAGVSGVDVAPIDITAPGAEDRLLAYVWPDHRERFARLEKVLALARTNPPKVERGDAADWLEVRLADPPREGAMRVLMHSLVWQYLPHPTQDRIKVAMTAAGAKGPLGWVTFEPERDSGNIVLRLRAWPGDDGVRTLAKAHPHGAWIEWLD